MPFDIELRTKQNTKLWDFKKNQNTARLQAFIDKDDREGYLKLLTALSAKGHKFARTKGVVYEMMDGPHTIQVPIKFQVQNSVITWAFIAPKDKTYQAFRDQVFNTASKAHASVKNSCETYYRGTNHYHFRVMHTYVQESEFNHNHYRTAQGHITPVEVYEHLLGFCAQEEGRKFIPTTDERDEIILKFAQYWCDFDHDINYVIFSWPECGETRIAHQLENIAKTGKLSPDDADKKLDAFFSSEHGKSMIALAQQHGLATDANKVNQLKSNIKKSYREIYAKFAPQNSMDTDPSLEPHYFVSDSKSSTSSIKTSPREEYLTDPSQALDEIDIAEYEAFAADLTKHCQSINKELLENLQLEDFRKGLLLYHALRRTQIESGVTSDDSSQRFHSDLTTNESIKKMIKELPSLQHESTEDHLGGPLLNKLITWVRTASPHLEQWIEWVSINGSRGLGAEIAQVRQFDGSIDLRQAIPQGDRDAKQGIAEIDFRKVDLINLFKPKSVASEQKDDHYETVSKPLKQGLAMELKSILDTQKSTHPYPSNVFKAKIAVIEMALKVLSKNASLCELLQIVSADNLWNRTLIPGTKSKLQEYIDQIIVLATPTISVLSKPKLQPQ